MNTKNHAFAASSAAAIVASGIMLLLGILGNMGIYEGAVLAMQQWHLFFDLSVGGIIGGMIEAAVVTFVIVYVFVWLYERMLENHINKTL